MKNSNKEILFNKKELIFTGGVSILIAVISALIIHFINIDENLVKIAELQVNTSLVLPSLLISLLSGLIITIVPIVFKLPSVKPVLNNRKYWVIYAILFLLGLLAFQVIVMGLCSLNVRDYISFIIAILIFNFYLYLMLKMYIYGYIVHKGLFYEVVRFGLVGVIAAIFDLSTCYLFQFIILPSSWPDIALTIVSVTCGFIIGVIVNYICSVYMVFKNTTQKNNSRTPFGRFLFVFLASIGLFMGYGLQYLFFDFIGLGYLLSFVLRTLIVLVWNYLSRKFFIFR